MIALLEDTKADVSIFVKKKQARKLLPGLLISMAPQVGLEPTTLRLTAECSAIELQKGFRM